ncbi:methyltransferase domain-containing protein [Histoplasma capsulatum var. duboisii H88]|uniref:Methyltransferase domain-containing protein n=2 Tax=Ajellomyces capsulatus (strain H88) TaxID=544711 RepID=A0A8A1LFC3_AJEC8|nr:methyltransferase domain-containing protein [Histoplasma capsulatum var. duboisii H88]
MMHFEEFLRVIGPEVKDAEEEAFYLYSQEFPSQNLGFVDSRANTVDFIIHGRDFQIRQSPTILSSSRSGGTTGAVLWKITPLIAEWLSSKQNILWTSSILNQDSTVVELGCGISGLIALTLAPSIGHYIATDQEYVHKLLKENLKENTTTKVSATTLRRSDNHHRQSQRGSRKSPITQYSNVKHSASPSRPVPATNTGNVTFTALDWELDSPSTLKKVIMPCSSSSAKVITTQGGKGEEGEDPGFDLLLSCDCIYNDSLIDPFVQTCAEICRLRPGYTPTSLSNGAPPLTLLSAPPTLSMKRRPTICIIAQQLRAPDVFESWLKASLEEFWVWRVCDEVLEKGVGKGEEEGFGVGLKAGSGYAVHVLVLRE